LKPSVKLDHAVIVQPLGPVEELRVIEGGGGGGQGQAVDVEGLAHPVQQVRHLRPACRVADAQPGQAVGLGEGAGEDQVGELLQPLQGRRPPRRVHVFHIGLVQHHHGLGPGQGGQGGMQGAVVQQGAGGIVGIGDPDHAGVAFHPGQHGVQVVAEILGRRLDADGAGGLGGQGIDGEGVARIDGGGTRRQEGPGHQVQHVVGAVAQDDLVQAHIQPGRQGGLQGVAVAVRIEGDFGHGIGDGLFRPGADAQGFSLEASLTMSASFRPISRASSEIGLPGW
jgi:hypothetical protein